MNLLFILSAVCFRSYRAVTRKPSELRQVSKHDLFCFSEQQKKAESPLASSNPFLEEEPGEDVGAEKDEDLTKVSWTWTVV